MELKLTININRRTGLYLTTFGCLALAGVWGATAYAAAVTVPNTFSSGQVVSSSQMNANFQALAEAVSTSSVPPGTIIAYAGATIPAGWLACDGTAVSRTTYAALFTAVTTVHGGGDGVATFNLPDLRGRFLRGVDNNAGRDPEASSRVAPQIGVSTVTGGIGNAGDQVGSIEDWSTGLPATEFTTNSTGSHNHGGGTATESGGVLYYNYNSTYGGSTTPVCVNPGTCGSMWLGETGYGPSHTHVISADGAHTHSVTGGGDKETRPANVYVQFLIKT
jgi:phage-related tail fiber protein